jgi:hypothetical protein
MSTTWREGDGDFSPLSTSLPSATAKLSYHMSFYYILSHVILLYRAHYLCRYFCCCHCRGIVDVPTVRHK